MYSALTVLNLVVNGISSMFAVIYIDKGQANMISAMSGFFLITFYDLFYKRQQNDISLLLEKIDSITNVLLEKNVFGAHDQDHIILNSSKVNVILIITYLMYINGSRVNACQY